MKTTALSPIFPRRLGAISILIVAGLCLLGWIRITSAIPLTGANGTTVEFAGIKSVGPKGMIVQIKDGDDTLAMTWDKFDVEKIRSQHTEIDDAYKKALLGETTEVNLGSFAPAKPAEKKMEAPVAGSVRAAEAAGYYEVRVRPGADKGFSSATFAISLPQGGDPKGILLISKCGDGRSIQYMPRAHGVGLWGSFHTKQNFAVLSYNFTDVEPLKAPPFIFADKGSGQALIEALGALSEKTGKNLTDLPMAIYGSDIVGAAFAFNFSQWKPEQVIAAVVSKGAFYAVPPTPESAKVPLLMIWGDYDNTPSDWQATHGHAEIFGNNVNLKPNWAYAMEPRGPSNETPAVYQIGKKFLEDMIAERISEEGLVELDRSEAWVGDLKTFEISKLGDPEAVLESTQTWLPGATFAEMWKQFSNGELPPIGADAPPAP